GQIRVGEQVIEVGKTQADCTPQGLERFADLIEQRVAARQIEQHLGALRTKAGQPQIDLQGPSMTSLLREQVPQVHQDLDVIWVAAEDALVKFDLKIEL